MKIRIEISEDSQEEIIIRAGQGNGRIEQIQRILAEALKLDREMVLHTSGTEHFVPIRSILFFETYDGKVYAHTKDGVFTAEQRLFELEDSLPSGFVRISKSAIANVMCVSSLKREMVGNGVLTFYGCDKKAYFSRGYYHLLKDRLEEMRFKQ